jgi:gluconate 2-dehydrogenase gamma chain
MTSSRPSAATDQPPEHADPDEGHVSRRVFLKVSGATVASAGIAPISAQLVGAQGATPPATPAPEATPVGTRQVAPTTAITFFNPVEAATVEALTARILPGTPDDPGAREAGVVYYIDRVLAGANQGYSVKTYTQGPFLVVSEAETPVERTSRTDIYRVVETAGGDIVSRYGYQSVLTPQEIYRRGLASVEAFAQSSAGKSFLDLDEGEIDTLLEAMDADEATDFDAPSGKAFFTKLRNDTIEGMFSDPLYGGNRDMVGWKLIGYPGARGYYTAQELQDSSFSAEPQSLADMANMSSSDMASHGH